MAWVQCFEILAQNKVICEQNKQLESCRAHHSSHVCTFECCDRLFSSEFHAFECKPKLGKTWIPFIKISHWTKSFPTKTSNRKHVELMFAHTLVSSIVMGDDFRTSCVVFSFEKNFCSGWSVISHCLKYRYGHPENKEFIIHYIRVNRRFPVSPSLPIVLGVPSGVPYY